MATSQALSLSIELFFVQLYLSETWVYNALQETCWLSNKNLKISFFEESGVCHLIMELIVRSEPTVAVGFFPQLTLSTSSLLPPPPFTPPPFMSLPLSPQGYCLSKRSVSWFSPLHLTHPPPSFLHFLRMSIGLIALKPHGCKCRRESWTFVFLVLNSGQFPLRYAVFLITFKQHLVFYFWKLCVMKRAHCTWYMDWIWHKLASPESYQRYNKSLIYQGIQNLIYTLQVLKVCFHV